MTPVPYYVTTPIYYVNSTPHIGHAYTTIAADILVRHYRQRGEDTFFLTGVDEHASKVARVAAEEGLTPMEFADSIVGAWQEVPRRVEATIDFFIRTTDDGHKAFVADFLQRMHDAGDIYEGVPSQGFYCVGCEAFKTEWEHVRREMPPARHRARVDRGKELVLRAIRVSGPASRALRRASGFRAAGLPVQRGSELHRLRAARISRSAVPGSRGAS